MKHCSTALALIVTLLFMAASSLATAQTTFTWSGAGSTWTTGADWSGGTGSNYPGSDNPTLTNDIAAFTSAGTANSAVTLGSSISIGGITFSIGGYSVSGGTITLTSATAINASNTTGTNTIASNLVLAGTNQAVYATGGGTMVLSGNISQTGSGALQLGSSSENLTLSGNNTFTGGVVTEHSGQELNIGSATALGTGALSVGNNSFVVTNSSSTALTLANALNLSSASGNGITVKGSNGLAFTGTVTLTGAGSNSNQQVLGVNSGVVLTLGGSVQGTVGIVKEGGGTAVLSGANTFSGPITVSNASSSLGTGSNILQFVNETSLYNHNTGSWTAANITVGPTAYSQTAILAFSVGGAGQFTTSDVTTLLTNLDGAVSNNGFETGSSIGFDTTGGNFTISNTIANTTGTGGGAVGLVKLGTNTLTLSGSNTYTGATTITGGNLMLTGSLASGSAVAVGNATSVTAALSGTGTLSGNLSTTATSGSDVAYLAPGVNTSGTRGDFGSAGTLHVGGTMSLGAGTNLDFDLSSSGLSGNDQIAAGGTLTIGSALTFNYNELSSTLDTANKYQLITFTGTAPSLSGTTFTTSGDTGYTAAYSIDGGGHALDVAFTAVSTTPTASFFNGQGTDLGTFANFDTSVSSGAAVSAALGVGTNVSFNANRDTTVSTGTLNTALDINSITFGTGSGIHSGMTLNGTGTLTIEATTANSNSLGNGITVNTGAGNNAINTAVALDNDQTWTVTDSTSTLTLGGTVSGAHMLSTAGSGVVALANAAGNTYSGGTSVGSTSKLLITNTSNSATGTGTVTVARGGALAGSGLINATSGAINLGTTSTSGTTQVYVGQAIGGDTGTTSNMTLKAASGLTVANTTLTFNLKSSAVGGSGTPSAIDGTGASGSGNELVVGTTAVSFGGGTTLQLNIQGSSFIAPYTPFVLFAGTGSGSGLNGSQYSGLTSAGTDSQGHTILSGVTLNFGGSQPPAWYANSYVFLNQSAGADDIEVEVVPEPSTWALMLGGLGLLVLWQRRRSRMS